MSSFEALVFQICSSLGLSVTWIDAFKFQEWPVAVAATVMMIGMRLCWRAPRYRMSIEERAKDGKLTEEQARRKIDLMSWCGPATVLTGGGLLAVVLLY